MSVFNLLFARPKPKDWEGQPFSHCERKLDGVRMTFIHDTDGTKLAVGRKETLNHWSKLEYLTHVTELISRLPPGSVVDGELHPAIGLSTDVSEAIKARKPLEYTAFALPSVGGMDMRDRPLHEARVTLQRHGFKIPPAECFMESLSVMQAIATERSIEGFMLKSGHYHGWYRIKPVQTIDAFVIEAVEGKGRLSCQIGSLKLGVFAKDGSEVCIGRCGSGLDDAERIGVARATLKGRVCEVAFGDVTTDLKLRFPRFMRWRDDKPAQECVLSQLTELRKKRVNSC